MAQQGLVRMQQLDGLGSVAASANFGGSATAVMSSLVFGYTQDQWLVVTAIAGAICAISGVMIQAWIAWHRVKALKQIVSNRPDTAVSKEPEI